MKKNKLFRLLTIALALVFLCQFAVPAFAYPGNMVLNANEIEDSYEDTYGSGYTYYFRVEKYYGIGERVDRAITQRKYHTQGTTTVFYAGNYEIYSASALTNSEYSDIRTLAQQIGVKPAYSYVTSLDAIDVPAACTTGYYSLKTTFYDYSGEWEVNVDNGYGVDGMEYNVYPFAAQQSRGIEGYIKCS